MGLPAAQRTQSIHVFAFAANERLLVSESEGSFTLDAWERAHDRAKEHCVGNVDKSAVGRDNMDVDEVSETRVINHWLRDVMREKSEKDQSWKA